MQFHLGRLIDHVHFRIADLEASKRFYRAVLRTLGRDLTEEDDGHFFSDDLFVTPGEAPTARFHLAFRADRPEAVMRLYDAGLAAGGKDNGPPGERAYHPGYYSAYVLDPDGDNIEAVWDGRVRRSAPSVIVTPGN